jgi:hypothetical protein
MLIQEQLDGGVVPWRRVLARIGRIAAGPQPAPSILFLIGWMERLRAPRVDPRHMECADDLCSSQTNPGVLAEGPLVGAPFRRPHAPYRRGTRYGKAVLGPARWFQIVERWPPGEPLWTRPQRNSQTRPPTEAAYGSENTEGFPHSGHRAVCQSLSARCQRETANGPDLAAGRHVFRSIPRREYQVPQGSDRQSLTDSVDDDPAMPTGRDRSDLDLFVIKECADRPTARRQAVRRLLFEVLHPLDIHVFTPAEFEESAYESLSFAWIIVLQARLCYWTEEASGLCLHYS